MCALLSLITTDSIIAQASPIQAGVNPVNSNIYHLRNVGIGLISPSANLHLRGALDDSSTDILLVERTIPVFPGPGAPTYKPVLIATGGGNVGIGTKNPTEYLHIIGGAFKVENNSKYLKIGNGFGNSMHFRTNTAFMSFGEEVRFQDILVIESSPGQNEISLNNDGSIYAKGLIIESNSGQNEIGLYNDGNLRAREVKVDLASIPDYVFADDYNLLPLKKLKEYITKHNHLPNIKSEKEFAVEGTYPLGEMNVKLLEKVEELTLYILQLEERIAKIENK